MPEQSGNRRFDRIRDAAYLDRIESLPLEDVRARRDECLFEREQLSLLRRMIQGRAEILRSELDARGEGGASAPLLERLSAVLAAESHTGSSRGEALRLGVPDPTTLHTRRSAERLVADAGISDPSALDEDQLRQAVEDLLKEEQRVSQARADVISVLDAVQDELKRRYKEDPTQALR